MTYLASWIKGPGSSGSVDYYYLIQELSLVYNCHGKLAYRCGVCVWVCVGGWARICVCMCVCVCVFVYVCVYVVGLITYLLQMIKVFFCFFYLCFLFTNNEIFFFVPLI